MQYEEIIISFFFFFYNSQDLDTKVISKLTTFPTANLQPTE